MDKTIPQREFETLFDECLDEASKIKVNKANFQHCADYNVLNGSILVDIANIIMKYKKAALSAQSSNTSDIEIEEDLVKQMFSLIIEIAAHDKRAIMNTVPYSSLDGAAKACASIAQSFADKQCQEFAEWVADNEYELIQGCYVKACARKATTTAELLTIYKQSK